MLKFDVKRRSFYISLCICILAVSAAGWSTYDSIKQFSSSPQRESSRSSVKKKDRPLEKVSKESIQTDSEGIKNPISCQVKQEKKENLKEVSAQIQQSSFIIPMQYSESSEFNDDLSFSEKLQDWRTSDGVDFTGKAESEVVSIANGKVQDIFEDPIYGTTAKIKYSSLGDSNASENGEITTYYSGLNQNTILVRKGDEILQGQKIANLNGDTLHLMTEVNNKFVNPYETLGIHS